MGTEIYKVKDGRLSPLQMRLINTQGPIINDAIQKVKQVKQVKKREKEIMGNLLGDLPPVGYELGPLIFANLLGPE